MENPGILKWRTWSTIRKAQISGALTGMVLTIGMSFFADAPMVHGPRPTARFTVWVLWELVVWPTQLAADHVSLPVDLFSDQYVPSREGLVFAAFLNASLLTAAGTVLGWFLGRRRKSPEWLVKHPGPLKWHTWPTVRKAQVAGALTGTLMTIAMPLLNSAAWLYPVPEPADSLLWLLAMLVLWPAQLAADHLGLIGLFRDRYAPSEAGLAFAALLNGFLLTVAATVLGWLLGGRRRRSPTRPDV